MLEGRVEHSLQWFGSGRGGVVVELPEDQDFILGHVLRHQSHAPKRRRLHPQHPQE